MTVPDKHLHPLRGAQKQTGFLFPGQMWPMPWHPALFLPVETEQLRSGEERVKVQSGVLQGAHLS